MYEPLHVENGQVKITAISLTELLEWGLSVDRKMHTTPEAMKARRDQKLQEKKDKNWKDAGAAMLAVETVRNISDSTGTRAFVVVDTALPENISHADILAADPTRGQAYARELRALLLPVLSNRKPIDSWFEDAGADATHAECDDR